jgi:hypothetical protein
MLGPRDSVVSTSVTIATSDPKGWTVTYPNHERFPMRIVAVGGDSIVTETGPYPSTLRPGQTITVFRTVGHYKGDTMTGTFEAHYNTGSTIRGKIEATRAKM